MTVKSIKSSTQEIPAARLIPRHIAIIMDGNGRWAKKRFMPRVAGHARGLEVVRRTIEECVNQGVEFLTLFAFSSENWRRPADEVTFLMGLFLSALEKEVVKLNKNNIRLRLVGDLSGFAQEIQNRVVEAEKVTENNTGLTLTIAANYGGKWDVLQAMQKALTDQPEALPSQMDEDWLSPYLSMSYAPEPDLFIRTGGEQRISNFLLWQLAYTELFFTPVLWPDFNAAELNVAIDWFKERERRFGRTGDQLETK